MEVGEDVNGKESIVDGSRRDVDGTGSDARCSESDVARKESDVNPNGVSGLMSLTHSSNLVLSHGRSSLNTINQEVSRSSHLQHSSRSLILIRVMRLISSRMI